MSYEWLDQLRSTTCLISQENRDYVCGSPQERGGKQRLSSSHSAKA